MKKTKRVGFWHVSALIFAILSILGGIGSFSILSILGGAGSIFQTILGGSLMIIAGIIILPPIRKRLNVYFSDRLSLILFLIFVSAGIFLISRSEIYILIVESPTKTAEEFARTIERKDYVRMYELFIPELQESRSIHDFVLFMSSSDLLKNFQTVRLDKVSLESDDIAYAYFTVSGVLIKTELPALKMEKVREKWKFNAFASAFTDACAEDCLKTSCNTYQCDNSTGFLCKYKNIQDCCMTSLDCSSHKPYCLDGTCSKTECIENKHCANNYFRNNVCDTKTGNCVQCVENEDCANEPYKKTCYEHRCVQCVENEDCPGSQFCNDIDLCVNPK